VEFTAWSPEKDKVLNYDITDGFLNFDAASAVNDKEHTLTSKTFMHPAQGLIAPSPATIFPEEADLVPKDKLHADHSFVEIYKFTGAAEFPLTELEMHGPYVTLKPGESMSFEENWS